MTISTLLSHLDRVRETGPGKYVAHCPAHDDQHPSLAIRESDDGVLLLYCHAGCEASAVLSALGLCWSDLYAEDSGW